MGEKIKTLASFTGERRENNYLEVCWIKICVTTVELIKKVFLVFYREKIMYTVLHDHLSLAT